MVDMVYSIQKSHTDQGGLDLQAQASLSSEFNGSIKSRALKSQPFRGCSFPRRMIGDALAVPSGLRVNCRSTHNKLDSALTPRAGGAESTTWSDCGKHQVPATTRLVSVMSVA
jgi:hypothetical protein